MDTNEPKGAAPSPRKIHRFAIGLNVVIQIVIAIAIVWMVNFISFRQHLRWDFSRNQKYALSSLTKNVLKQLDAPVKAIVFIPDRYPILPDIGNLLKEYQYASKKKFTVEYVDPYRNIIRAKELVDKYKAGTDEAVVIIELKGKTKFVKGRDMAEVEKSTADEQQGLTIKAFKGEEAITSALMELQEDKQNKVYFLVGHGEPTLGSGQLDAFRQYLERENIKIQPISLINEAAVPADASGICILGPTTDFSEREIKLVSDYWEGRKGRIVLLLEPKAKTPRLNEWLKSLGVTPQGDRVVKTVTMGGETGILPAAGVYLPSAADIIKDLNGHNTQFLGATESLALDRTKAVTDKIKLLELVDADEGYWGNTNLDEDGNLILPIYFHPKTDHIGPLTLAVAVEKGGLEDSRVKVETSRMVVAGNAAFITDAGIRNANVGLDFGLNAVNWVLNREKVAGIAPKAKERVELSLNENELTSLFMITVVLIPVAAGLLGLYVTWIRQGWSLFSLTGMLLALGVALVSTWFITKWWVAGQ